MATDKTNKERQARWRQRQAEARKHVKKLEAENAKLRRLLTKQNPQPGEGK